ncbi:MAG TPA: hypothetical protein VK184_23705 [Nostocaceae cyanobacterium]|nr:hypothetical protein [Nostocaceae cyanobacterium]
MSNNRQQAAKESQDIHKENIKKSLEHRLQIAKTKGDEQLIRQLEAEMAYYS